MNRFTVAAIVTSFLLPIHIVKAQVPQIINYQGRVTFHGTNFDGTGQFQFALVDEVGATNYWSNDGTAGGEPSTAVSLAVTKGLYSVELGESPMAAITPQVFRRTNVWLRVWFDDGAHGFQQLSPDQALVSVPFAMALAAGAVGAEQLGSGTIRGLVSCSAGSVTGAVVYVPGKSILAKVDVPGPSGAAYELSPVPAGTNTIAVELRDGSFTTQVVDLAVGQIAENINFSFQQFYRDADGDGYGSASNFVYASSQPSGYVTNNTDCNDNNASVHPGATEVCNGIDDDCDGQTDEQGATGCVTYYRDNDGDGYGVTSDSKCLCAPSGNYTATVGGDCNDSDPNVNPAHSEVCGNGMDDDCDGLTDEEGALGCVAYYYDNDGDGYGVSSNSKCLCAPSGKYTALVGGDCNDNNANVNPGHSEVCGNGIDDDCDGLTDEEGATGCVTYYYDNDGDGYGVTSNSKCLCAPSGKYTATVGGDCNDANASIHPGATEVCNGMDDDCDALTDEEGAQGCVVYYYDNDGDGYGITNNSKCLCAPSGKYTALVGGDCNDNNANINPGHAEVCGNGMDDDCDGQTDEGC